MTWLVDPYAPPSPPGEAELPFDDGEPLESERHRKQMNVLIESLDRHWADRNDVFVGGNMFLYFSELQTKKNDFRGPDVFVVLGTVRRERKSWVVWQEERTPDVIIELLSPRTEQTDRGEKMRVYGRVLRVPEYYLYDPGNDRFEAYRLNIKTLEYEATPCAPNGLCPSDRLGLQLGMRQGEHGRLAGWWLRWFDGDGNLVLTEAEQAEQAAQTARRAEELAAEAEQKARRAEELAAEAEQKARRAEAAAEVEKQRTQALWAELGHLRRQTNTPPK